MLKIILWSKFCGERKSLHNQQQQEQRKEQEEGGEGQAGRKELFFHTNQPIKSTITATTTITHLTPIPFIIQV